ncbi:unnamed protein product [Adineta ricciae]|uniref:NAD(P)(+)--arginine ADP-ribosyltransferase n=1 Tax=Adineta ricciae TaxID=249248 RepID=A0A815UH01_ADIRI|nr:unnamed protein product [Adineta ricciae]CAF1568757.1 unnamed protein product [Adineta ricciae]
MDQYLLISLDSSSDSIIDVLKQFQHVFTSIQHFVEANTCIDFITNLKSGKCFLIISFEHIQIIPLINHIPQIHSIYILFKNEGERSDEDPLQYEKVQSLSMTIDQLITQIKRDTEHLVRNRVTINSLPNGNIGSFSKSGQNAENNVQEATFMYSQILRNIFVQENYTETDKNEMIDFFRQQYHDNPSELGKITRFQHDYTADRAIYWYTMDGFLYRTINRALRTQDILTLYHLRYFIKDLHLQLKARHADFCSILSHENLTVYRGVGLPIDEFEKLKPGYLVSFSEFLSTSRRQALAEVYVRNDGDNMQAILFEIELNCAIQTSTPFADISEQSQFNIEQEILFSMGSVFRIESICQTPETRWDIKLSQTSDEDQQLKLLHHWLDQAIFQVQHFHSKLSSLMLFISDYDKAEYFLRKTMAQPSFSTCTESIAATLAIFGEIYFHQNKHDQAMTLFQQTVELLEKVSDTDVSSTIQRCYTGLSEIYLEQGELMKALEYSQKSLDTIRSDEYMKTIDLLLATRHNNIGHIYYKLGHVKQALHYFQKALDYTRSLLPNIPLLSKIYCNFAMTYELCGDYSNAELYWHQGLEHHLKSLPNDTDATAYLFQAVALNLSDHKKYHESIDLLQKSLIVCKSQGTKALCCCYKSFATSYHALGKSQLAVDSLHKAIELAQTLTDMNLSIIYVDSGNIHYSTKQYEEALIAYEKALNCARPTAKLSIQMKIFLTYTNLKKSDIALQYYENHLQEHTLELDSDDRILMHYYIGVNYDNLKNYDQALKYFQIAQEVMLPVSKYRSFIIDILERMGDILIKREQWLEANNIFRKLLTYQPSANVHLNIGIINIKQNNFQDAIQSLRMAQELAKMTSDSFTLEIATRQLNLLSRTES